MVRERFGYKIWALCSNDGFPYNLILYKGKETPDKTPLGQRVVYNLLQVVKDNSVIQAHEFFFDNFFTSYQLLCSLANDGIRATGTIRENGTNGATKLMSSNAELKKKGRGSFEYRSDGTVYICKWNDNAIVGSASNYETHEPLHKCKRRVKSVRLKINQLHLISSYNKGMGGVDLMDRLLAAYRPSIRGKKWYWPLFTNLINITVVASWRAYNAVADKKKDHLEYRREIALSLMMSETVDKQSVTRAPAGGVYPPETARFDGLNHKSICVKQGRYKVCKRNTVLACQKCDVRLHNKRGTKCFQIYHKQNE